MSGRKDLQRERGIALAQARGLIDRAKREGRELTPAEDRDVDRLFRQISHIDTHLNTVAARRTGSFPPADEADGDQEPSTFRKWLVYGESGLREDERMEMHARRVELSPEARALGAGTGAAGGFTVPDGFVALVVDALKQFGGMRAVSNVITTDTGAKLPIPTADDTGNVGAIVDESSQHTEQDITFSQAVLNSFLYSSKVIRVSHQLLQDTGVDLEQYLARKLAERIGRITNTHFTNGTGTGQPRGVITDATLGKTGATGQTSTVIYEDLVDLEHSVDELYRQNAAWMFHDDTLKAIKKLKDGDGRPLWLPGVSSSAPETILGHPFVVNNDVPQMAASAKSILFGDFRQYWIRDVRGLVMLRLVERYADFAEVGFLAFSRHDGVLIDAGTGPVKFYQNAAS